MGGWAALQSGSGQGCRGRVRRTTTVVARPTHVTADSDWAPRGAIRRGCRGSGRGPTARDVDFAPAFCDGQLLGRTPRGRRPLNRLGNDPGAQSARQVIRDKAGGRKILLCARMQRAGGLPYFQDAYGSEIVTNSLESGVAVGNSVP